MSLGVEGRPVESRMVAQGRGNPGAKTRGRIKSDKFDDQRWHSCVWMRSGRCGGTHRINRHSFPAGEERRTRGEWSPGCQGEEVTQEGGRDALVLKRLIS